MQKRALITGVGGQDGSYLAELLLAQGYEVFGMIRNGSSLDHSVLPKEIRPRIHFLEGQLEDKASLVRVVGEALPHEVYNLAGQSDVSLSFRDPAKTLELNYRAVGFLVDAVYQSNSATRVFQASSSEMFGRAEPPQSESSKFLPVSPYGISKLLAHQKYVVGYREKYHQYICSGILFNHESPRRGMNFVTRKITSTLAKISLGHPIVLELGNLETMRDWGFAGDYVRLMWLMLQQEHARDFCIASGKSHSVRDIVDESAKFLGMSLSWEGEGVDEFACDEFGKVVVRVNPEFFRPNGVVTSLGDNTRARKELGWTPGVDFSSLVRMMIEGDLQILRKEEAVTEPVLEQHLPVL